MDHTFGISYSDNLEKAKKIIMDILIADDRISKDPEPFVRMKEMADSSVNIASRVWVNTEDYWDVYFDVNEKVYEAFNKEGVSIPFPQMDVHLNKLD